MICSFLKIYKIKIIIFILSYNNSREDEIKNYRSFDYKQV
jgi:hypothetical protein